MEVLADSIFYYSQVLLLLGFPVYSLNTWRRSNSLLVRFISQAGAIITRNLWSGGAAGQLLPLGCSPGSLLALMKFKRIVVNYLLWNWHRFHFDRFFYGATLEIKRPERRS